MGLREIVGKLLGFSAYQSPPPDAGFDLDSPEAESTRRALGGNLQLPSYTQTRWYQSELETAEIAADTGNLQLAGKLIRSIRKDGVVSGVMSTATDGLVRLPKRFRGDQEVVAALEVGHDIVRSLFDEMCPPTELALMAADGKFLGISVGELVPVKDRDYPVLVRLDPEFLYYRWNENRWYYRATIGLIPITPGDGRWVLHVPGGRISPWQHGLWRAVGRAYIRKEHAQLHKDNWEGKLANPARVAVAPQGAAEKMKDDWWRKVMAWGINTVFGITPGYDIKLLESNGRGWESFNKTIADQNTEIIIAIAGQTVTVEGGTGFQNSDVHKTIRADLIKATADALAYTLNTQVIPQFIAKNWGEEALTTRAAVVEWDVTPPKDRNSEAMSMGAAATAITQLQEALQANGLQLDIASMCERFGIPVKGDTDGDGIVDVEVDTEEETALHLVEDEDEEEEAA